MNNLLTKTSYLILVVFFALSGFAQERIVHGVVTAFDSIPLINVDVRVQSTKQMVKTDTLGRFSVACNSKDKLKFSANGFITDNVKVKQQTKIIAANLKLKQGEKAREYAIGYTRVSDRDKLNSLATLDNDDLDFSQFATMKELIEGKFAGVRVINGEVIVRGVKPTGNSGALIVVDGVSQNKSVLSALAPSQVKSINIIKDGSTSIYGVNGANGVVVIVKKKGSDLIK